MQLRYMGFDQEKNIREYLFDGVAAGEVAKHFVVSADLALFDNIPRWLAGGTGVVFKATRCRFGTALATAARTYER